jgi:hypothetical protein
MLSIFSLLSAMAAHLSCIWLRTHTPSFPSTWLTADLCFSMDLKVFRFAVLAAGEGVRMQLFDAADWIVASAGSCSRPMAESE